MQYIWSIFPCTEGLRIFPVIILHSCPFYVVQAGSHVWVEQRLPRFLQEVVASPCAWSEQRLPAAAHLLGCSQTFIPTHHTWELFFCRVFFIAKYVKGFFCKFRVCFGVGVFCVCFTTSEVEFCFISVFLWTDLQGFCSLFSTEITVQHTHKINLENAKPQFNTRSSPAGVSVWV